MGHAQPATESTERAEVQSFRRKYAKALESAYVSQAHTDTEGWQNLYALYRKDVEKVRKDLAERLAGFARSLSMHVLDEDDEKAIKDIVKEHGALCVKINSFTLDVIEPIRECVYECRKIIDEGRREAREAEASAPLHSRGLLVAMDEAINGVVKVNF
jgi:hypothetical protein